MSLTFKMKSLDLKLSHKVLILVTVPIVLMLVFVATLASLQKQAEDEIWRERHSKAVIAECNSLMRNVIDSGMFLYLFERTGQRSLLQRYKKLADEVTLELSSLKLMLRDSPHEESSLKTLDQAGDDVMTLMHNADQMVEHDIEGAHSEIETQGDFVRASTELLTCLRKIIQEQQEFERSNPQKERFLRLMTVNALWGGVVVSIGLAITLALFFNKATTNRLLVLVANANRLAGGKPLKEKLQGSDEIAHLDGVFHDMADALADAAKRKQELIQMVTHDLRTPMTSIDASLRIMMVDPSGGLPEKTVQRIGVAKRSSERLLNLINDLLDIERLETGSFPIDRAEVFACKLIESPIESLRALAGAKGVTLESAETDLCVFADPARIEQVLVNLLSNAIKFSPDGASVQVEVSIAGDDAEFRVIDHGRGVPEEYKSVIFERFGQVKKEDSERGKGTGLGLPICKALVEAHKGSIGVRSKEGEGSTFWFRIPRVKD